MARQLKRLNYGMLLRVLGSLLLIEGLFMLVPMLACLAYGEADWRAFGITAGGTALTGWMPKRLLPVASTHFGKRESYLLTGSVWVVFSFFGMIPFIISSAGMDVSDAFFEAMSGFTTTGATCRPADAPPLAHGIMMWQAMMQWLGGMGIILFTLAVIPTLNSSGGMQMFNAEVPGITHEKIMPRISQTAISLWSIYAGFTLILTILLLLGPMDLFDSVCHAFGTMSTGGFSSNSGGIAAYHSDYVTILVTVFMLLGGIDFALIFTVIMGRWERARRNEVVKWFVFTILLFWLLFDVGIWMTSASTDWRSYTIEPAFQVVSTITSTGYTYGDISTWGPLVLALTFLMMFSGGCAGSTSGGAKFDRLLYAFKRIGNEVNRCIHPNAIYSVRINGRIANPDLVAKVVLFLGIYVLLIAGGGVLLSAMGCPTVDSFFSSFACLSNTGFGASVTGYGDDFASIPDMAKWVLAALMLIGRLEIFTILVLFAPAFWRK